MIKHYNFSNRKKEELYKSTGGICFYCGDALINEEILDEGGKVVTLRHNWNIDHKIPLSRGGTNEDSNLVPSCFSCNAEKGTMTSDEFIASRMK